MFDSRLPFVPKNLQLTTLTLNSIKASVDIYINKTNQLFRKENRLCDDPFIINVPYGVFPIQVLIFKTENRTYVILWKGNV